VIKNTLPIIKNGGVFFLLISIFVSVGLADARHGLSTNVVGVQIPTDPQIQAFKYSYKGTS